MNPRDFRSDFLAERANRDTRDSTAILVDLQGMSEANANIVLNAIRKAVNNQNVSASFCSMRYNSNHGGVTIYQP